MDGYYHLTSGLWAEYEIDPIEFFQDDWEDDGDGGFYIPMYYDQSGNGIPDMFDNIIPDGSGGNGSGTTIPGSGGFDIG